MNRLPSALHQTASPPDSVSWREWRATEEMREDIADWSVLARLHAVLGRTTVPPAPGDSVPPLWHWALFLGSESGSELGPDGHVRRGGFLPPVPLKRRMFASGSWERHGRFAVGDRVRRVARVTAVDEKTGSSGPLILVTVTNRLYVADQLTAVEEQYLAYTDGAPFRGSRPSSGHPMDVVAPRDVQPPPDWEAEFSADEIQLFRFSAVTFNSHRIHYDVRYANEVEGYPALVVHGPLLALAALEEWRRRSSQTDVRRIRFRIQAPVYVNERVRLFGHVDEHGADLGVLSGGVRSLTLRLDT